MQITNHKKTLINPCDSHYHPSQQICRPENLQRITSQMSPRKYKITLDQLRMAARVRWNEQREKTALHVRDASPADDEAQHSPTTFFSLSENFITKGESLCG
jgi:hypothetical protein